MSSSSTGAAVERRAIKVLQAQGYTVHRCLKTVVRTPLGPRTVGQDVFGCIDIVAKRANEPTRWIQCTSTSITRKVADLATVPWTDAHDSVEIWRWVGGKGKRIDGRTGLPRPRMYFQVYYRHKDFVPEAGDRLFIETAAAPRGRVAAGGPETMHAETGVHRREFDQPAS